MDTLNEILRRLEHCARHRTFESLETDWLEIKPVPSTGHGWDSIRESLCAFLNTRGGIVILGVKDEQKPTRHYSFTGYTEDSSGQLSQLRRDSFKDARRNPIDVGEHLLFEVRPFMDGQIAVIHISPLPEERKYCFFRDEARERVADRDEKIPKSRVDDQEERKREMETYRELRPVEGVSLEDLSLQRINELIQLINQGQSQPIETLKSSLADSVAFLERRRFMLKSGQITTLGVLVAGKRPEEHLLFRSHLDAFVDVPNIVAQDKKTFRDNILQLMEAGQGWTLRNIYTGVSHEAAGSMVTEYPEKLIRECINNALAHRDYSVNRPVQLTIKPRTSLSIRNPGHLPHELVFEKPGDPVPVRRIFPNPRARNPRLADILKLHNKWEGKGIGMADLVNFALGNQIDLPHYLFHSEDELSLCIPAGRVLDDSATGWLELMDGLIATRSGSRTLTPEHQTVLAYLIKSEQANRRGLYTLALTPANNHFGALADLKDWRLIELHSASDQFREVYVVCRELANDDCHEELRKLMGTEYDQLHEMTRQILTMICLAERYSTKGGLNAKEAYQLIKDRLPQELKNRGESEFYRSVRYRVEKMAPDKSGQDFDAAAPREWVSQPDRILAVRGPAHKPTYRLNRNYQKPML